MEIKFNNDFAHLITNLGMETVSHKPLLSNNTERIVSVIDDDIDISELFHHALCENIDGVSIVSFNDPVAAFEHFTENKESYALVISDLRMPGINGLELLKKVKRANSKVRTILMSAFNFEEHDLFQKYMKEEIIDSTIEKPVTIQRLSQRVRD